MDFGEGESLDHRIEREGALPEAQVVEWADQLLGALAYCHAQGVIHRDVKPQNVIIRPDGQATLVDFGLVKLWDPHDPRTRTAMRGMGTPEYAPPEQYDAQMGHTDPRSDVYSLGATLYHALTGQAPPTATMRIASPGILRHPRTMNPNLSPHVEQAILRSTELAVDHRFATAQDMAAALRGEALPVGPPISVTTVIPEAQPAPSVMPASEPMRAAPAAQPIPSAGRKRAPVWAWVLGGVAVLALVAGLAGAVMFMRGGMGSRLSGATPTSAVEETSVAAALEVEATPSPSPSPPPSPTSTNPPPSPTNTPTRKPTQKPSTTSTPTETPEATSERTPAPTPTKPSQSQAATPTPPPAAPPPSGALINFEQWGTWRRGDQPYGELTQSQEKVRSGSYAAKLRYNFPSGGDDYVVFVRPIGLSGQPNAVGAWVYGDGSGHFLNIWVQDAQDEMWSVHLGKVGGAGWQQMVGFLAPGLPWPSGHLSGPDNGVVDYPVRFHALVVDRPSSGPQSGLIYIDDVSVWHSETPTVPTPPAAPAATPAGGVQPTPIGEPPVSADPLDFVPPEHLDGWETTDTGHKATIIINISGGAPPFTVHHDTDVFVTDQRECSIQFNVGGCAIIHSITVDSADGQSVTHDYYIRAPGCD